VKYKGCLIEAFEEWPRRWFDNVRCLDDEAIPGMQSSSLRTFSVRPSKIFAEVLERRLKRIAELEATPINASKPEIEMKPSMPRVADRRFRRI
jgi:hypothetical protein